MSLSCNILPLSKVVSPSKDSEKGAEEGDAHLDRSQSSPGASSLGDRSGPLFSIYSKVASEEDNKMVERWQKDADGILIFTGLFSAAVAAFLAVSFQGLRPDPQETSAFYLRNIYLVFAELNTSIPSAAAQPTPFSPPANAILVNLLWILSLGISLTGAIMATMLQQWARQFLRLTQAPQPDPKTKARIRALFAGSTDKLFIKCLGYLLPCYLHLSVLLFFIGLLLFLHDINTRIFNATLWFFMFSMTIYTFFTILPFFLHDSLLFTPVSAFPVAIVAFIICIVTTTFGFRFNAKLSSVFERLFKYIERTASSALDRLAELDTHILEATLDSLGDDDAVERFFEAIPDFFPSNSSELLPLTHQFANKFKRVMCAFLDRTFQPTMVAESVKSSRLLICLNASRAAWPVLGSEATSDILFNILNGRWPELLQSVEIGHSLRSWSHGGDEEHIRHVRSIVSRIIANTEKHNDRWSALVEDELGVSKDLLSDYLAHSDNVLLATFNNITRQIFRSHHRYWNVSSLLSKCDVSRALPSLQHDFCDLWNDIVREAQGPDRSISADIVKDLRHHFIALHTDSTDCDAILDQAWSYPSCTIAAHRPHPLPNTYGHPAEDISHALATHSSTQAVPLPLRGDVPVAGIRPLDLPAHHNTSPLPNFSASQPFPTPSDVTTIDARTDISSISSTANPNSHPISSGMATSQQNECLLLP